MIKAAAVSNFIPSKTFLIRKKIITAAAAAAEINQPFHPAFAAFFYIYTCTILRIVCTLGVWFGCGELYGVSSKKEKENSHFYVRVISCWKSLFRAIRKNASRVWQMVALQGDTPSLYIVVCYH
jgi:hypothetical protein